MTISVTSLGSASSVTGSSGATLAITLGTGVAAGSLIVVAVTEGDGKSLSAGCTVADTAGNTYTSIQAVENDGASASGFGQLFYCKNATALSSGNSITVTKQDTNSALVIAAISASGIPPGTALDVAVGNGTDNLSTTPSVGGGATTQAGDLNVAMMCWADATSTTATQPGAPWTSDANLKNASATTRIAGLTLAHQVNAGTTGLTYAPTLGSSNRWAAIVAGFFPQPRTLALSATCTTTSTMTKNAHKVLSTTCVTSASIAKSIAKVLSATCVSTLSILFKFPKHLRNAAFILQKLRSSAPSLTELRDEDPTLDKLRVNPPTLGS